MSERVAPMEIIALLVALNRVKFMSREITVRHGQLVSFRYVGTKKVHAFRLRISWLTSSAVRNAG